MDDFVRNRVATGLAAWSKNGHLSAPASGSVHLCRMTCLEHMQRDWSRILIGSSLRLSIALRLDRSPENIGVWRMQICPAHTCRIEGRVAKRICSEIILYNITSHACYNKNIYFSS